jgi:hypothetical protein
VPTEIRTRNFFNLRQKRTHFNQQTFQSRCYVKIMLNVKYRPLAVRNMMNNDIYISDSMDCSFCFCCLLSFCLFKFSTKLIYTKSFTRYRFYHSYGSQTQTKHIASFRFALQYASRSLPHCTAGHTCFLMTLSAKSE